MPDLRERLTEALASRYTIERELGRGGMAIVYLAEDLKHQRKVALKVLRPELAASLGAERFLREIRTAAQLTHPNILPLYDSGEADGALYYTMPYLEGESLRDRLNREKQLPIEDALQITKEVADALGYAHDQGIIHRDIKPENILFQRGHALVADFGIARAVRAAGAETLTETGLAVGTPAYMSPEQGVGESDLDGRSDLYSLGCVLYEMLTGETPYLGATPQAIIAKKLSEPTPRVSVVRDRVPAAVEVALDRVLSRSAVDRYATALDFTAALSEAVDFARPRRRPARRLATLAVLAIAVVAAGAYGAWWFFTTGRPGTLFATGVVDPGDRVLLADFVNRTGDSTLSYAAEEALRVDLSDPRLIRLVDRADVREALQRMERPSDTRVDNEELAREVAERENAKAFITGELGRIGARYQLTARILASADGAELFSARETARNEDELVDAVGRLGGKLRRGIGESVRNARSRPPLARVTTASLPALRAYSEAVRSSGERSRHLLREAISHDSAFAAAHVRLAGNLYNLERLAEANEAADRAYRFRDRLTEQELLRVTFMFESRRGNFVAAEIAQRRLASLTPEDPRPLTNLSDILLVQRKWSQAESIAVHAIDLGERLWITYWNAIEAQMAQRRFAAVESTLTLMTRNGIPNASMVRIRALIARREYGSAARIIDSITRAAGREVQPRWPRIAAIHGRLKEAERALSDDPVRLRLESATWAYRWLGDREDAGRQLDAWFAVSGWDTVSTDRREYPFAIRMLAELGRVEDAQRLYSEWAAVGEAHPRFSSNQHEALGHIAMAEGLLDSAASAFLRWHASPLVGVRYQWNRGLVEAAGALDRMGNADSAVVLYERALAQPSMAALYYDVYWYPFVLRRLGELHEFLGHRQQAIDYYSQFVDLWNDADPELQPQVEEARAAVVRLAEEEG